MHELVINTSNITEPKEIELVLCKPNVIAGTLNSREQISVLSEAYSVNYTKKLVGVDELTFKIPYYITKNHQKVKNPNWDLVQGDYLILMNNEQFFMISNPKSNGGEKEELTLQCFSLEYELTKRTLVKYKGDSRVIYTALSNPQLDVDDTGLPYGILNYLSKNTSWSVGYVNNKFKIINVNQLPSYEEDSEETVPNDIKYRSFDISNKTYLDFLNEVQKAFQCIFRFDTINKRINVYDVDELMVNRGLYISRENYIKTIDKEIKHEQIVTRLYVYGQKDISIRSVNPTGQPYIEDFSFYMTEKYMSKELISSLEYYNKYLNDQKPNFVNYMVDLEKNNNELFKLERELSELELKNNQWKDKLETALKFGYCAWSEQNEDDLTNERENQFRKLMSQLDELHNQLDVIEVRIINAKNNGNKVTYIDENGATQTRTLEELEKEKDKKLLEIESKKEEFKSLDTTIKDTKIVKKTYDEILVLQQDAQQLYNTKKIELDLKKQEIELIYSKIEEFRKSIDRGKVFKDYSLKEYKMDLSEELMLELDYYIREKEWRSSDISKEKELYEESLVQMKRVNQPPLDIKINIIDFLKITECENDWEKLILGDIVNIKYDNFDTDIQLRLISYTHNIDGNSLTLEFSNLNFLDNPYVFMSDILQKAISVSSEVDMSKYKWDKSEDNATKIGQIIDSDLETAKNRIISGRNQNIWIDERGIHLQDKFDINREIRMVNDCIAFTRDGWNKACLALTPDGLVAENITGHLVASEQLVISNNAGDFRIDDNGIKMFKMSLDMIRDTQDGKLPKAEILINPQDGFKIRTDVNGDGKLTDDDNKFWIDMNGKLHLFDSIIELIRKDKKGRILLDPEVGIKLSTDFNGDGIWQDNIWMDEIGRIHARNLYLECGNSLKFDENGLFIDINKLQIGGQIPKDKVAGTEGWDNMKNHIDDMVLSLDKMKQELSLKISKTVTDGLGVRINDVEELITPYQLMSKIRETETYKDDLGNLISKNQFETQIIQTNKNILLKAEEIFNKYNPEIDELKSRTTKVEFEITPDKMMASLTGTDMYKTEMGKKADLFDFNNKIRDFNGQIAEVKREYESEFKLTKEQISLWVNDLTQYKINNKDYIDGQLRNKDTEITQRFNSLLKVQNDSITAKVTSINEMVTKMDGEITESIKEINTSVNEILPDKIRSEVKKINETLEEDRAVFSSKIEQTADKISMCLQTGSDVITALDGTSRGWEMMGQRIVLKGFVTFEDLKGENGKTEINGDYIKTGKINTKFLEGDLIEFDDGSKIDMRTNGAGGQGLRLQRDRFTYVFIGNNEVDFYVGGSALGGCDKNGLWTLKNGNRCYVGEGGSSGSSSGGINLVPKFG